MNRSNMRRWSRQLVCLASAAAFAVGPLLAAAQETTGPAASGASPGASAVSPESGAPVTQPSPVMEIGEPSSSATTKAVTINFKDAPIDSVLEHLSDVFGYEIIKDTNPIDGRVTMISKQPINADETLTLLNAALKVNGYTAVSMGPRILKIMSRDKAKNSEIPVHFGADPAQIELTDDLITQVIPVRSVDAVKLKADITPLLSTDAELVSNGGSNSLIMTDTSANIHRIVEIIANLDKHDALENTIRVRQLKYADATDAAKLITDIFKTDDSSNSQQQQGGGGPFGFLRQRFGFGGPGGGGPGGPGGPGGGGGGDASADKGSTGKVTASADDRTNTVVVSGPVDTLAVIDTMLTKLDADPSEEQTFFLYQVKNGQALDMAVTINSLFGNSTSGSSGNRSSGSSTSLNNQSTNGNRAGVGSSGAGSFGGGSSGGGLGGSSFGSNATPAARTTPGASTGGGGNANTSGTTASQLVGQVFVVADADTNSLLVASSTKFEDRIKQIITQLDRPVAQVLIKVLIAEVSHDNSNDLGIDWSVLNTRPSGNGEVFSQSVGTAANASAAGLASAGTGGLVVNVLESNINATLIALAQENRLDVLSRPYILATDNQIASITVGQEVPFITNSQITDTGQTLNSIQYQDIGIILDVTPHINPDGLVTLDVSPQISQLTSQTIPITTGVNAPVFDLRSADSRVSIKDGQTIVIGGMMQDTKTTTTRKIPLLGDIPIIGQLFRQDTLDKKKTELLIFLTPHVAMQPDRLLSMSQEEVSKGTVLTTQAVDPGTYQEHMKAMQLGGTSTYPPSNSGFISSPLYGPAPGSGAAPESGTAPGSGVWPGNPPAGGTTPGVTPAPGAGDVSQPPMAPPAPAGSSATQGSAP